MRLAILALILAVPSLPPRAQQVPPTQSSTRPSTASPGPRAAAAGESAAAAADSIVPTTRAPLTDEAVDSLRTLIERFRRDPEGARLPAADDIVMGGRTIESGRSVEGPVATAGGPLHVFGTVNGDAIAVGGDVVIHPGARVTGNAIAALGQVTLLGGSVEGEMRELGGALGSIPRTATMRESPVSATRHALALSSSWLVIVVLIGIGVLVFAGGYLDGVAESLEGKFGRSFWAGVATQLALAPALALLVVALALTVIGLLLIPFAIVAFVLAVAGLITLGFLAVARITGESLSPAASRRYHARGAALRALVIGVALYMGLWVLAAAFAWVPMVETVLRGIAVAVTWVAATAGLGAAILSRGGTRRPAERLAAPSPPNDLPWQTPTPVTGVVAARRPTPASSTRER